MACTVCAWTCTCSQLAWRQMVFAHTHPPTLDSFSLSFSFSLFLSLSFSFSLSRSFSLSLPPSLRSCDLADMLEGNLKGILKVILAVAERYQPKSVKPRGLNDPSRPPNHSLPSATPPAEQGAPHRDFIPPYRHPSPPTRPEFRHSLSQPTFSLHGNNVSHPSHYRLQQLDPRGSGYERDGWNQGYGQVEGAEDVYSTPADQLPMTTPPQVWFKGT